MCKIAGEAPGTLSDQPKRVEFEGPISDQPKRVEFEGRC